MIAIEKRIVLPVLHRNHSMSAGVPMRLFI
jgi:hypothetical protein